MLPHTKYDLFLKHTVHLKEMIDTINNDCFLSCTSSGSCIPTDYVSDIFEGEDKGSSSDDDDDESEETQNENKVTQDKKNCLWPNLYKAVVSFKKGGLIREIPMGQTSPEQLPTRVGSNFNSKEKGSDSLKLCEKRLEQISRYILKGLETEVYDDDDV